MTPRPTALTKTFLKGKIMPRIVPKSLFPAALLAILPALSHAEADKSASSAIQLPQAGGTVTTEEGAFRLNTNTGSATFSLPLPELPVRGKFGPQMMLGYSQFAGDSGSGLGIGWSFQVPSIRVNTDRGTAIPGMTPEGDFFHHLDFEGKRLMFHGMENGVARYLPEVAEEATTILRHDQPFDVSILDLNGGLETVTIAAGFEVRMADGSRMYFSAATDVAEGDFDGDETFVTRWPLVLRVNANRNAVRYEYQKHGGRSYLTGVSFAGGQSRYDFDLIDTRSSLISYASGAPQANPKLYGRVRASFDGSIYDQWCMGFIGRDVSDDTQFVVRAHPDCQAQAEAELSAQIDGNSVNVLDQLRAIWRFGDTGGAPLGPDTLRYPDITFDYSSWTTAELADRDLVFDAPNLDFAGDIPTRNLELADLNMDALVDIVQSFDTGDPSRILLGAGDLDQAFSTSAELVLTRPNASGLMRTIVPRLIDNRFHFADVMGDSFTDIIEIGDGEMHIFDGNAAGQFPYLGRAIPLPGIGPGLFADGNGRFIDVNLDGLSDIVATRLNGQGRTEMVIWLNLTQRQPDGSHVVNFARIAKALPFEADEPGLLGRRDIRLTDVNGDRLPDLVQIKPNVQGFCIYANRGNLFTREPGALLFGQPDQNDTDCGAGQFQRIAGMQTSDNVQSMWYVDANGDGVRDFASMGSRTDQMRIWLGFGDGSYTSEPLRLALNERVQVGLDSASFRSRVTDLDADGQSEIIVFQQAAGDAIKPVVVIDFNRTEDMQLAKANLLTVVDFASGRRHDIRYATSTDEMLRDRTQGRETRSLHFPVVIAKQLVTSEGAPGALRRDVQTEEFFYHDPFYDVLNRRFIGFAAVEKVTYGDEYAPAGEVTQRSSLTYEQFYTFADQPADLFLAGKLKVRRIYEVAPDAMLLASAEESAVLDPTAVALHSASTETRTEELPEPGRLMSCQDAQWQTVPTGQTGTSWLRKTSENLTAAASRDQGQDPLAETCVTPEKTVTYDEFDAFNLPGVQTVTVRDRTGPEGLVSRGFTRTTRTDYDAARATLSALGIVNAASERRTLSGSRLFSVERFNYLPDKGGNLGERRLEVFSSLRDLEADLETFHFASHELVKTMDYDALGNVTEMGDQLGVIETVDFDPTGTLPVRHVKRHGEDDALNQVTQMRYDGPVAGRVSTQVSPLGMEVAFTYDALGRRIAEQAADGAETLYDYKFGLDDRPSLILTTVRRYPSAAETPEGESEMIRSLAAFNARGNQIAKVEDVFGGSVRVFEFGTYNRNEKLTFRWTPYTTDAVGGQPVPDVRAVFDLGDIPLPDRRIGTAYEYDGIGRVVREEQPSGKVITTAFEPWGRKAVTTWQDEFDGRVTMEQWRIANEAGVHAVVAADGAGRQDVTLFTRDGFGYLTGITLPGEDTPRRFLFNTAGDLEFQSIPGMGEYHYFYDERGRQRTRVRSSADGLRDVLEIRYDFLNRRVTEIENGTERVRYTYDRAPEFATPAVFGDPLDVAPGKYARVVSIDPNGRHDIDQRFGYDANGRLVQHEVRVAGQQFGESFHQTLDGRINRTTGPGGLTSDFALGPDMKLRSVAIEHDSFPNGRETVIEQVVYNPEGSIARMDYRNDAFTELTYDPATLYLTDIDTRIGNGTALQDLAMTFNQNGSITTITDNLATLDDAFEGHVDRSGTFRYDFKNQLLRIARYGADDSFGYSPAGTFTRNDEFADEVDLAAPADAPTALIPVGTTDKAYVFDGFGQLASSPRITGTVYDVNGRLIRAQTETHDVFFGYDQTGLRIYKEVVPVADPDAAELYLFPTKSHFVGPQGAESFVNLGTTRLVRMEHTTGRWFYYLKDHLDSSDYVMNSDGTPVEQMLYRAYGTEHKPEDLSQAWADHEAATTDLDPREPTHHRFTGKYLDDQTGLYYYGARYYDPALGRFITPDPLYMSNPERCTVNPIACTLFAYANNNPMLFVDPTGLEGIVEDSKKGYRSEVEDNLQRIDPTARVDKETGEISQSWIHGVWLDIKDFFVPGSGYDTGRELVSRIIDDSHTTTIKYGANRTDTWKTDTSKPIGDAQDVTITYDPSRLPAVPEFNGAGKPLVPTVPDPGIVIGHELIHATHGMAGQWTMDTVNYKGLDGSPRTSFVEEARTTGVGGQNRAGDITENGLRDMLGLRPRNHYPPPPP